MERLEAKNQTTKHGERMAPQRYSVLRDEKCLFPVRNDGKLLVDEWRVTELAISSGEKGLKLCRTTCPTAGADPRYLAAAAWALLLWRFAEVDTVQIGLQDIPPGANEDILEAGLKRGMKVLAASRRQVQLLNELWQGDTWSISDADPTCYSYFDTGIVICRGNSQDCLAKCRSPNQLRKANGEVRTLMMAPDGFSSNEGLTRPDEGLQCAVSSGTRSRLQLAKMFSCIQNHRADRYPSYAFEVLLRRSRRAC